MGIPAQHMETENVRTVRVALARMQYKGQLDVKVGDHSKNAILIFEDALEYAMEELPTFSDVPCLTLHDNDGTPRVFRDGQLHGADWLADFVTGMEIII